MIVTTTPGLTNRDASVLRAVAAGRCTITERCGAVLSIDGFRLADQFVGLRLLKAGLIADDTATDIPSDTARETAGRTAVPAIVRLTPAGRALLPAAA